VLRGGTGFNTIDGGSGIDTGVLERNQNEYFSYFTNGNNASGGITIGHYDQATQRYDEVHQFVNVEFLQFADGTIVSTDSFVFNDSQFADSAIVPQTMIIG